MSLQKKIILFIAAGFFFFAIAITAISRFFILESFERLESENAALQVRQIHSAFADAGQKLFSTAGDWASWDDTYHFVQDKNSGYIADNLTGTTGLSNLQLNLMLFFDRSGSLVFGKSIDLETQTEKEIPGDLIQLFAQTPLLREDSLPNSGKSGIIALPGNPVLVAIRPILQNNNLGNSHGSLLIGRYLDAVEIGRLAVITNIPFSVLPVTTQNPEISAILPLLKGPVPIHSIKQNDRKMTVYSSILDIVQTPVIVLKIPLERKIYRHGQKTIVYAVSGLLCITLFFGIFILFFLRKLVIAPLARVGKTLHEIRSKADPSLRLPPGGKDELGQLENNINDMLASLEKAGVEKTEMQEQLVQAQKMQAVGQLAGGVAHDFNNMLGAVSGFAEMIDRKFTADNPTLKSYIATILNSSKRMSDLASKLLAFAHKGKYQSVLVNMNDTIHEVIGMLEHTIDKRVTILKKLQTGSSFVMGDPVLLQNAVLNLAVNARDTMPQGGDLTFATEIVDLDDNYARMHGSKIKPGTFLMIAVSDTGEGMDETVKSRIFEPFFTTKSKGKGTGLGLASVFGTMASHNGSIEVYSEPGKGSTFKMYFPSVNLPPDATPPNPLPEIEKGTGHILLIDDEEAIRLMAVELLTELGYNVVTCKDGQEAVTYYSNHFREIDLVILDMIMPVMGGLDCMNGLKAVNPAVKAIVASGYSVNDEARQILKLGARGFIQKPFDLRRLSKLIHEAMTA